MIERTLRIITAFSVLIGIAVLLFGRYILLIFFGNEFLDATVSLNILAVSLIFSSITIILTNTFASIGKPDVTLSSYLISLFITGSTAYIFIPIIGIEGAAISVLAGLIYNSVHLYLFAHKELEIEFKKSFFFLIEDAKYLYNSLIIKK